MLSNFEKWYIKQLLKAYNEPIEEISRVQDVIDWSAPHIKLLESAYVAGFYDGMKVW